MLEKINKIIINNNIIPAGTKYLIILFYTLYIANFTNSNLFESDFTGANILNAVFEGANLNNATWINGKKCNLGSIGKCKQNN